MMDVDPALVDLLRARSEELAAYVAMYEAVGDSRADVHRARGEAFDWMLRTCEGSKVVRLARGPEAAPLFVRPPVAMVTEVGGQLTATLFRHGAVAQAGLLEFKAAHAGLIVDGQVGAFATVAKVVALSQRTLTARVPKIVYVTIGVVGGIHSVSLHDDLAGADAEMAMFDRRNAFELDEGAASRNRHAAILPPASS